MKSNKSRVLMCTTAITLFAALAIPVRLAAQQTRYQLIDLGTFGGPTGYLSGFGEGEQLLNNQGTVAGSADTSTPDPYFPNCFNSDCFLSHSFLWRKGVLTDLGALPGVNSSVANAINARGWVAGASQNGKIDPLTGGPAIHAVLWKNGEIIDLGTLGTGIESAAAYVNDGGQVIGFSTFNTVPAPTFLGAAIHAFIWENGVMRDLGTLGGPESGPSNSCTNEREGLVAGASQDPFLWDNGTMTDLGTLGGTSGFAQCANNQGQVTGQSNLAGDLTFHPFLWDRGVLTDLGTLGGDFGFPNWLNNAGEVVGAAGVLPGSPLQHAFLWREGVMTDLGTLGTNSNAFAINSEGQIVGRSRVNATTRHAFLWENGGPMIDLNSLIPSNSSLELEEAFNINDRGEITGLGLPPGCALADFEMGLCGHAFLLIPCDHAGTGGCEDSAEGTVSATETSPAPVTSATKAPTGATESRPTPSERAASFRARLAQRYHFAGTLTRPPD